MKWIPEGGVTSPVGYRAAGVACGLKDSGNLDLALLVSDRPCSAAGVFTRNRVVAAPVIVDSQTLAANRDRLRAVVANAGIANACTGQAGLEAARRTQRLAAEALACEAHQVLVLSTGVIGVQLDLEKVSAGIREAAGELSVEGGRSAAQAIMTTDTRPKQLAVRLELSAGSVVLGGMAKGAGMVHPDMATMLAVLTTDAVIPPEALDGMLRLAVGRSFHRICVDGDTSTNDTVLLLANAAGGLPVADTDEDREAFTQALVAVCVGLAQAIVRDGEGASRFVTLQVGGARDEEEALQVARAIATSPLVKTAFAGGDPNWGRILAAAGRAGVEIDPDRLALWIGGGEIADYALVREGAAVAFIEAEAAAILAEPAFTVRLDLNQGDGEVTLWTCDLTQAYVRINADYRT